MNNKSIFQIIQNSINRLDEDNMLIGVDGGQGSGKTCFIKELKSFLCESSHYNIVTIEIDDFLIERKKRENVLSSFFDSMENISHFFDFKRMSKVLQLFRKTNNKVIKIKNLYNTKSGKKDRYKCYHLTQKNIILVGGPYLLSPLFPPFNIKIFLYAKKHNRLKNTLTRILNRTRTYQSQKELFKKFEKFYEAYYSGRLSSYDLIIDNNDFHNRKIIKNTISL